MHANTRKKYYLEKANIKLGKIQQSRITFKENYLYAISFSLLSYRFKFFSI